MAFEGTLGGYEHHVHARVLWVWAHGVGSMLALGGVESHIARNDVGDDDVIASAHCVASLSHEFAVTRTGWFGTDKKQRQTRSVDDSPTCSVVSIFLSLLSFVYVYSFHVPPLSSVIQVVRHCSKVNLLAIKRATIISCQRVSRHSQTTSLRVSIRLPLPL